jgi:hypothetical protein
MLFDLQIQNGSFGVLVLELDSHLPSFWQRFLKQGSPKCSNSKSKSTSNISGSGGRKYSM